MIRSVSLNILGRVQGVGFRFQTLKMAHECRVNGFVKNLPDGSVYIEAEGEEPDLDMFLKWCRKGPSHADVITVEVQPLARKYFSEFFIA